VAVVIAGCGDAGERSARDDTAPPPPAAETAREAPGASGRDATSRRKYEVVDVTAAGRIRGSVRFIGTLPPPRTFTVGKESAACGTSRQFHPIVVGSGGGLIDAVVSLTDIDHGAAQSPPSFPPDLVQHGCRFTPHVVVVPEGGTVEVLNNDPLTHNLHTAAFDNRSVNRSQPRGSPELELSFTAAEKVKVACDIHPWMSAWIVVTDRPYTAVTDEDGSFVLEQVPPGTYTLEVWHEALGARSRPVTVTAGQTTELRIEWDGPA